jgi:hypothetical protein
MPINGYRKTGRSMLDFIMAAAEAERRGGITKEEFTRIRRFGSEEELIDAVERMNAAGGYDNLE